MTHRACNTARPLSIAGIVLAAGLVLSGCLDLKMRETVHARNSILTGEFSYELVIPKDLEEIDPEGETGLDTCILPAAGDPLPAGADTEARELADLARRLNLVRTLDVRDGQTLHCAWTFAVDLRTWVPVPESPLFSHVRYAETPRPGWWLDLVPTQHLLDSGIPAWLLEELLAGVRLTSTVAGPGVTAVGYVRARNGAWRWEGSMKDMLRLRPRYWVPRSNP